MCHLLETIKCFNGKLYNLEEHNFRFNSVRKEYFGLSGELKLEQFIHIPVHAKNGLFRCRVIYAEKVEKVEFIPHQFRQIRSLKVVVNNEVDYRYKYVNRKLLQDLFELRKPCDDIIIVKNNSVTDSFMANLVFFDGNCWITPDTPLLPGTQRARLLKEKKITAAGIQVNDIVQFKKAGLINAFWNLENMPQVPVSNIFF